MKKILLTTFYIFTTITTFAFGDTSNIPIARKTRHEDIAKEIQLCDKLDGKLDGILKFGSDEAINGQITDALFRKPNEWRQWVETNDAQIATNNEKVGFLKNISDALIFFRVLVKERELSIIELPAFLDEFEKALKAKAAKEALLPIMQNQNYAVAKIMQQVLVDKNDKKSTQNIVYLKYVNKYPEKILPTLSPFASESFADSLLNVACKNNPVQLYSFAQSKNSALGKLIHNSQNGTVKQIAQLSELENPLMYFPFLDDIIKGKQSIAYIKSIIGDGVVGYDSITYYKLLVKTASDYYKRMGEPTYDTAIAYTGANGLLDMLKKKSIEHFVSYINALHDVSNLNIRMKAIQPLAPKDLYYMMVMCENEIYTSSYKHSFNRMLQLMGAKPRTDSLLYGVNFDHFRKFIKMAANYNKLDTFLKLMPPTQAETIMTAFVNKLDIAPLEDAVDVADAYSSITDKKLQLAILQNIKQNENNAIASENKKGKIVYGLLNTILQSLKDSTINLTKSLGIPPIFDVANKYMQNDKGKIVQQVFFYGDKDGKTFYPGFRNSFSSKEWKVTDKKEWMEAASIKGNVILFANKPLDNDANLDDTAQVHLIKYMEAQGLKPNVVVHRGHSYWLERTMDRMPGDAKIVVLGSCGGFQNLNKILEINPDAHIVSTKEIGAGDINGPILNYINLTFSTNGDLNWRKMWQALTQRFSKDPSKAVRDSWENYIPPYKNLGAIFLKAYALKASIE
jgi:hypothetical protein